jgi:transmembrane sensor
MAKKTSDYFIQKLQQGPLSEEDSQLFDEWLKTAPIEDVELLLEAQKAHFESLNNENPLSHPKVVKKIESTIDSSTILNKTSAKPFPFSRWLAYAAMLTLIISGGIYFSKPSLIPGRNVNSKNLDQSITKNRAILFLSDGSKVFLRGTKNGVIANQESAVVLKVKEGKLVYRASKKNVANHTNYNTIATPKGGQYQIVFSDGSMAWLNAASSLKFPTIFKGKQRRIELTGEAYFEVAKDKKRPFTVITNHSQVEVLGTHFNVSAYKDDPNSFSTTTLLEGSVRIVRGDKSKIIKPGEQAKVGTGIKVLKVNADEAIEWKNGNFNFSHENIESIMKKVARWYDVDIEYRTTVTKEGFVGTISQSKGLKEILRQLELTGLVHFKIVGRRVIVMP